MNTDEFREELRSQLARAQALGRPFLDVEAGPLHKSVLAIHGGDHRMPSCCGAMYGEQRAGDEVLYAPPKGKGPRLKIRYKLPR